MDLIRLYSLHAHALRRHLRSEVRGSDQLIEDACQFAWSQLVRYRDRVGKHTAYGWLHATARHEAIRLLSVGEREVSLEAELERGGERLLASAQRELSEVEFPFEVVVRRQQVDELRALPVRQQRMLWLKALGLTQREVAVHEQCTPRTVERQLVAARRRLRLDPARAA